MTEKVDSKPESLIGTTVGDYKIIDIIGQGGMGVVYTAEHTQLHHHTACKVLRAEMASHPETIERFLQEAKFISRIRHLNLIDIFDIGELPDKRLYYVMEKLTGRTLAQQLLTEKLSFISILSIMRQICAGLAAAHAAGLVHRDLKPDNLFLVERPGEAPLLKIMDFGVAEVRSMFLVGESALFLPRGKVSERLHAGIRGAGLFSLDFAATVRAAPMGTRRNARPLPARCRFDGQYDHAALDDSDHSNVDAARL